MKSYDSIRREFSCSTLIEHGITKKQVQSIIMCLKETYSTVWEGKHLSAKLLIKNAFKQDVLQPLFNLP